MDYQYYILVINLKLCQTINMEQINQNNFAGLPLSTQTIPCSNLQFYVVYFNNSAISNNDYSNILHIPYVNNDIIQNSPLTQLKKSQNLHQKVKNEQILDLKPSQIYASQIYQQASSINSRHLKRNKAKSKTMIKQSQDQDYQPKESSQFQMRVYKLSQTKNIPKNYQKAILLFISKNIAYTYKVLQHCNINFEEFMKFYRQIKTGLGSMAKLRSLWMDSQNPYAKVFRIISKEYLRKHSLGYIFNSRVVNITKHIKYRQIIQGSIGKPQAFTYMKYY